MLHKIGRYTFSMQHQRFLSVCIPAHNEGKSIERVVAGITGQSAWKAMRGKREILVCANGCTDDTVHVLKRLQKTMPDLKVVVEEKASLKGAWNRLVREAHPKAENLCFLDADVLMHEDCLKHLLGRIETGVDVVQPRVLPLSLHSSGFKSGSLLNSAAEALARVAGSTNAVKPNSISGGGFLIRREAAERVSVPNALPENALNTFLSIKVGLPKIVLSRDAVLFQKPPQTIGDHFSSRVRHITARRDLKKILGEEYESAREQVPLSQRSRELMRLLRHSSLREKAGILLNQTIEVAAQIASRLKSSSNWKQVKTSKL